MNTARFVAGRLLWTVLAVYLVLSGMFLAVALTPDPNRQMAGFSAAVSAASEGENPTQAAAEAMAAYDEARNRDRSLAVRWADWMTGYLTGNWGWSYHFDTPVRSVVAQSLPLTLAYVVPGTLLGLVASVVVGVFSALTRRSVVDRLGRAVVFVGLALPAFVLATFGNRFLSGQVSGLPTLAGGLGWEASLLDPATWRLLALPTLIVALNLFAVQTWIVRAQAAELAPEEFVKTLRAHGAGVTDVARHIVRNAAAPLSALFVSEVLVVLFVTVYVVESILGVRGLGWVTLVAFDERDVGLVLASVMVPVVAALLGNLVQDLVAVGIDPRVSEET